MFLRSPPVWLVKVPVMYPLPAATMEDGGLAGRGADDREMTNLRVAAKQQTDDQHGQSGPDEGPRAEGEPVKFLTFLARQEEVCSGPGGHPIDDEEEDRQENVG